MRTRQIREWTYEDVRLALEKVYGPIAGVTFSQRSGYILEECDKDTQPSSASGEMLEMPIQVANWEASVRANPPQRVIPGDNTGSPPTA